MTSVLPVRTRIAALTQAFPGVARTDLCAALSRVPPSRTLATPHKPSALPVVAPPPVDVVATIAADGRVTFSGPITEGRVRLRVESAHARDQEFQIRRILPGRTVAEALAWRLDAGPSTPRPFEPWAGLSDAPAGGTLVTTIDFEAGAYFVGSPRVAFTVTKGSTATLRGER